MRPETRTKHAAKTSATSAFTNIFVAPVPPKKPAKISTPRKEKASAITNTIYESKSEPLPPLAVNLEEVDDAKNLDTPRKLSVREKETTYDVNLVTGCMP
jgi:hypothetical protein